MISEGIKEATRSGDKIRLETLRSLRAAIIEFNKSGIGRALNEEDEVKLLNNSAKRRRDAIELYEKGGRQDLADKEKTELKIIQEFLPAQLTEDEIRATLKGIIESMNAGPSDTGKVIGAAMKAFAGKAPGATVQLLAKELLGAV
jgi:uncharacterized protein YqeY